MNDFVLAGFFCKKCFNFIDGSLPGSPRTCPHCTNFKGGVANVEKKPKREQQPGRR